MFCLRTSGGEVPEHRATRASSAEPSERRIRKTLGRLPRGARGELLQLLASPSEVRADAIRQFHERPETEELAEVLIDLESEPVLRLGVMDALKAPRNPEPRADHARGRLPDAERDAPAELSIG
jgi:hypothetical protein